MIRRRTFLGSLLGSAALLSVPPFIGSLTQNAYSATEPVKGGTLNVGLHFRSPPSIGSRPSAILCRMSWGMFSKASRG